MIDACVILDILITPAKENLWLQKNANNYIKWLIYQVEQGRIEAFVSIPALGEISFGLVKAYKKRQDAGSIFNQVLQLFNELHIQFKSSTLESLDESKKYIDSKDRFFRENVEDAQRYAEAVAHTCTFFVTSDQALCPVQEPSIQRRVLEKETGTKIRRPEHFN